MGPWREQKAPEGGVGVWPQPLETQAQVKVQLEKFQYTMGSSAFHCAVVFGEGIIPTDQCHVNNASTIWRRRPKHLIHPLNFTVILPGKAHRGQPNCQAFAPAERTFVPPSSISTNVRVSFQGSRASPTVIKHKIQRDLYLGECTFLPSAVLTPILPPRHMPQTFNRRQP